MDTSEQYIKMRQAAIPDLGMGTPPNYPLGDDGVAWVDYCVFIDRHGRYYYSTINMQPIGEVVMSTFQLERQDQLQEMVPTKIGSTKPNYKMISELNHFFDYWDTEGIPNFLNTWEQLWLAFCMSEKYNKHWDGSGWK